ncbi:alpha/beta hydrolase [Paenibacillus zeisoli]|uniref:Alpha/beta hydrolase n=1 Tax=Paenibacillus zeisoli TaxID=2496267 RepID=A0A3S1BWA0_9BACL|nr:alpha/beta fold hydrolase [Paenibacillus zeisoli]RUT35753.1 alpha/beta hydrolase [Paenibacillus zeisoli]
MFETYVSPSSTCSKNCSTVVCFFAGVLTYRDNFEDAANEIAKRYRNAKIVVIFPYGTANGTKSSSLIRLLVRQLAEVGYDLARDLSRRVIKASQIIHEHIADADHVILIGHSAGGVMAYRTGLFLEKEYGDDRAQIFAVGSPKFFLKDIPYNSRFTYITGQNPDRITQIGRWRRPGSRYYRGAPGQEIQVEFNPAHQGWRFHASYFLKSAWTDSNEMFHTNSEDLVSKIHELYPGT